MLLGVLSGFAGGAVGPGRMAQVGPLVGSVFFHGIVSFGIGGLVGGLIATWWSRRHPVLDQPEVTPQPDTERTVKLPGLKLPGVSLPSVKKRGETTSGETPSDR